MIGLDGILSRTQVGFQRNSRKGKNSVSSVEILLYADSNATHNSSCAIWWIPHGLCDGNALLFVRFELTPQSSFHKHCMPNQPPFHSSLSPVCIPPKSHISWMPNKLSPTLDGIIRNKLPASSYYSTKKRTSKALKFLYITKPYKDSQSIIGKGCFSYSGLHNLKEA